MEALRNIYERIPGRWKLWILSFIAGLIVILIWDVGTLLVILFVLFSAAFILFKLFGIPWARATAEFSITQFLKRIRGMILFALFPAVWELIRDFSLESIIALCLMGILALTIWEQFDEIMRDLVKGVFGTGRRRR